MRHIRRLIGAVVVVVLLVTMAIPAASAAQSVGQRRPLPKPGTPKVHDGKFGIQRNEDGVFNSGEVMFWMHIDFGAPVFDSDRLAISNFTRHNFVNSRINLNDQATSVANGNPDRYAHVWEHAGPGGANVLLLPYGQCNSVTCYAYSYLGWANDLISAYSTGSP